MDKFSEDIISGMEIDILEPFILELIQYSNQLVDKVNELEDRIIILEEGV